MTAAGRYDVAIVGGGMVGCSTALALRRRGLAVAVYERGICGAQASGVNYGGVRRQGRPKAQLPLSQRAHAIWPNLVATIGIDGEFVVSGHLKLARSEADMAQLERYARATAEAGLDLQLLSANGLRDRFPWLGPGVVGASFCPGDGHANPRLVAAGFARAARRAGADIFEHCPVAAIATTGAGFALALANGGEARAGIVINCAGAWAGPFAAWTGEAAPLSRIYPGLIVTAPHRPVLSVNIGVQGGGIYARQVARGNCVIGGARGRALADADFSRPGAGAVRDIMADAAVLFPALRHAQVIRSWSGTEGDTPDRNPVIGPSATVPGLLHAFGFSGAGFQISPGVGDVLAELACDGATPTPIDAFSLGRFAAAATSHGLPTGGNDHDEV